MNKEKMKLKKLGGKTQMKQIKRNVPSTGKRIQADLGLITSEPFKDLYKKVTGNDLTFNTIEPAIITSDKSKLSQPSNPIKFEDAFSKVNFDILGKKFNIPYSSLKPFNKLARAEQLSSPGIALPEGYELSKGGNAFKTKKIETPNKTKGNFKEWFNDNVDIIGDFTNGLIGIGSAIASNRINNKMLNNIEELPETTDSIPLSKTKLKTSYNIHPQLAKARKIANRLNRYVDRNTSSSQTAINRRRQNELDYLENFNNLYGQKENIENQLINQDRMLQHQTDQYNNELANRDIVRRDARKAENVQLRNTIAEKKAENSVALADNVSSIINNMIMNRKQTRSHNKTLKTMAAGFPNISSDYLKELGLV